MSIAAVAGSNRKHGMKHDTDPVGLNDPVLQKLLDEYTEAVLRYTAERTVALAVETSGPYNALCKAINERICKC